MEELVDSLASKVENLGKNAIDEKFLRSEDFSDLLEAVFKRAAVTASVKKRECLRDVLINHLTGQAPSDLQDLFLDLVLEISDKEVQILDAFRTAALTQVSPGSVAPAPNTQAFRTASYYGMDEAQFRFAIQHLIARGLMFDDGIGRWNTAALQIIATTELGNRFIEFLGQKP